MKRPANKSLAVRILAGLIGASTLASQSVGASNTKSTHAVASVERTIKDLTAEFVEGYNSGNVKRMMHLHGPTYVDVNLPNPRQTRVQRRDYYLKVLSRGDSRIEVVPQQIEVDGNRALVWGKLTIHNGPKNEHGKTQRLRYMEVWRKLPEGWRATWGMDAEVFE